MPLELPHNPDFEQLRKQAKELARAYRAGEANAAQRVAAALPNLTKPLRLSGAQIVIAREHGFGSWRRLKAHVEALRSDIEPARLELDLSREGLAAFRKRPTREIAAVWVQLARDLDFDRLVPVLAIARTKAIAIRERMLESGTLSQLVDALIVGSRHHNPNVRYVCAHAMDMFADERCAAVLAKLLDDPVPRVRRVAVHSLGCDDCKVVPLQSQGTGANSPFGRDVVARVVQMALSDPSIQVRRHCAYSLALFDDVRATQAIEMLLVRETDEAIRRGALDALRSVRARAG